MTPVEIIALVFVLFALVKLVVIFKNPESWKGVVKSFYSKPIVNGTKEGVPTRIC